MESVVSLGKNIIQHGAQSSRAFVKKVRTKKVQTLIDKVETLAEKKGYTKVIFLSSIDERKTLSDNGYVEEAQIPGFFNAEEKAIFLSKFYSDERKQIDNFDDINEIIKSAKSQPKIDEDHILDLEDEFDTLRLGEKHSDAMAALYKELLPNYPISVSDKDYLIKLMNKKDRYEFYGSFNGNELAASSLCEIDLKAKSARIGAFARSEKFKGNNLAILLIRRIEKSLIKHNIKTAYCLAPSLSRAMNKALAAMGYSCGGTLANNSCFSNGIESANVWHKSF